MPKQQKTAGESGFLVGFGVIAVLGFFPLLFLFFFLGLMGQEPGNEGQAELFHGPIAIFEQWPLLLLKLSNFSQIGLQLPRRKPVVFS